MIINKKYVFIAIFIIWCGLWVNFTARDFYKMDYFTEYAGLVKSDTEGKRALVYGVGFYELLNFAREKLPKNASYEFAGVENFSLASRRGIYYLYPLINSKDSGFILVYRKPGFQKDGFHVYDRLDGDRFILRKD